MRLSQQSKKGVFKIYLGSPAGDVARAFKDDGEYTSTTSDCLGCSSILGTKQINYVAAKYVLDRLQDRSGAGD